MKRGCYKPVAYYNSDSFIERGDDNEATLPAGGQAQAYSQYVEEREEKQQSYVNEGKLLLYLL